MIVTRQRRKPFPFKRLILPLIAIGLIAFAFIWPPSRNVITSGPMGPLWRTAGNAWGNVSAPFHFAAQDQVITDRNRQIAALQAQLAQAQSTGSGKDKQIQSLQSQIDQLSAQAASARGGSTAEKTMPRPTTSTGALSFASDAAAGTTPDIQRTAQYWTSMDPDNAAKIAQRLPPSYVARVFAQMQPDAVGAILDALPASYAAKLTQEHPLLQR